MTCAATIAREQSGRPTPLAILELRCWARAVLVREYVMDFHTAIDGLQEAAKRDGLVERCGQDTVQALIACEFEAIS